MQRNLQSPSYSPLLMISIPLLTKLYIHVYTYTYTCTYYTLYIQKIGMGPLPTPLACSEAPRSLFYINNVCPGARQSL